MLEIKPFRTVNELKDSAYNYFIAFKINLRETDKTKIELQIKKVLSDPKGSVQSRRLLELKNDIIEIMCNDSVYDITTGTYRQNAGGRIKEAETAKKIKLKEALDIVHMLCATRKMLLKSEIKKIYDFANFPIICFTELELDDAIKPILPIRIKIIDNLETSIPFDKYQKTEQLLKPFEKKIYTIFLDARFQIQMLSLKKRKMNNLKIVVKSAI